MKTKEFIKLIEDVDGIIEDSDGYLYISKLNHSEYTTRYYGRVSKKHEYCFDTNYTLFTQLGSDTRNHITSALFEYSKTPIAERESIELSPEERVILNSLSLKYIVLKLNDGGVLTLEDYYGIEYYFGMVGRLFDWVKRGEVYNIEDLLND